MRYMRYTAYVCMFGRRGKGAEISLMGVRFFEIAIPLSQAQPKSSEPPARARDDRARQSDESREVQKETNP